MVCMWLSITAMMHIAMQPRPVVAECTCYIARGALSLRTTDRGNLVAHLSCESAVHPQRSGKVFSSSTRTSKTVLHNQHNCMTVLHKQNCNTARS
jgi:hypothetical protein